MRKCNLIFLSFIFLSLLGLTACFLLSHNANQSVEAMLIVNGRMTGTKVHIYEDHSELPLVEVLRELGGIIDWSSSDVARITLKDKVYTLNLKDCLLCEEGGSANLLVPAPGSHTFSCVASTDEIILDDNTLKSVLFLMEASIFVQNSIDERRVYVNGRK